MTEKQRKENEKALNDFCSNYEIMQSIIETQKEMLTCKDTITDNLKSILKDEEEKAEIKNQIIKNLEEKIKAQNEILTEKNKIITCLAVICIAKEAKNTTK